jgi:sulfur-carrier protein adenylyltransferase/sulfurtransferase
MLTDTEKELYNRQIILPGFDENTQEKLSQSKVLVVGAGGLGSAVCLYLAASGIGTLGIVDNDQVSLSNLQRQVLYSFNEVGQGKAQMAKERLTKQNPLIKIIAYPEFLNNQNVEKIIGDYDIIVGALDNAPARYLVNDFCKKLGKIYVHGAISDFYGQVAVFDFKDDKSYRDLFPEVSSETAPKGVIATLPGITGTLMANEVIKIITGIGEVLINKILLIDILENTYQVVML